MRYRFAHLGRFFVRGGKEQADRRSHGPGDCDKVHLEVEAKDTGKSVSLPRFLLDSLKNIPDQPLTFISTTFAVELTSDNGKYKVMGENPDNFPKEPASDEHILYDHVFRFGDGDQ